MTISDLSAHVKAKIERYSCGEFGMNDDMAEAIVQYVLYGRPPGGFLGAVLENNLREAFGRADDNNRPIVYNYVHLLYNAAPSDCWGSPERVRDWIDAGGMEGHNNDLPQDIRAED